MNTERAIAHLRAARIFFKRAGKVSLEKSCDDMISEAMEELESDRKVKAHERRIAGIVLRERRIAGIVLRDEKVH